MLSAKYGKADIVKFMYNGTTKEGIIFSTSVELINETKTEHARAIFVYEIKVLNTNSLTPVYLHIDENNIIEQL